VKINELIAGSTSTLESNLLTALELIRHRYKDKEQLPKIKTSSLINMILNTDHTFSYQSLIDANDSNPAVKNIIKNFNKDYVELNPVGDENSPDSSEDTTNATADAAVQAPVDTVPDMAKRAAKKRDSSLF